MCENEVVCIYCGCTICEMDRIFETFFKRINGVDHRGGICKQCAQEESVLGYLDLENQHTMATNS